MFTAKELKEIANKIDGARIGSSTEVEAFAYNYGIEIKLVNKHHSKIKGNETQKVYTEITMKKNGDYKFSKNRTKYVKQIMKLTDLLHNIIKEM